MFVKCTAINHSDQIKISFVYTNVNNQVNNHVNNMECLECTYTFTDVETRKLIDARINNIIIEPTETTYLYLPHSSINKLFGKKQTKDKIHNSTECYFVDVSNWFFIFDGRKCVKGSSATNEDSLKIFNRDLSVVSDIKTDKLKKLLEKMPSLVLVVKSKTSDFMKNKNMYKPSKYSVVFNWRNKPKDWAEQRKQKGKGKNNLSTTKKEEPTEPGMFETMLNYGRSAVASVWQRKKEYNNDDDFDENLHNLNTKNVQTKNDHKQNVQIQNQKVENKQPQKEEVQKNQVETEESSKPNNGINLKIILSVIGGVVAGIVLIVGGLWYFLRKRGGDKYRTVSHNDI